MKMKALLSNQPGFALGSYRKGRDLYLQTKKGGLNLSRWGDDMERLSAEQIANATDHITDTENNRRAVRKLYHKQDESHLWPIRGKFNVTTRAANRVS